ncbi:unnamed protein product, partial [Symbiodinium necroappetens]
MIILTRSRSTTSKGRSWPFLVAVTPRATQTTSVMALRSFTTLSKLPVPRWWATWMNLATLTKSPRA